MQNRVEEFRTLVEYPQPRIAASVDACDALAGARAFRRAVAPVYLRRNQEDVLTELADRIETESWVQLTNPGQAQYAAAVSSGNLMAMRQAAFSVPDAAKLERLQDLVEEAAQDGMKVVVFSYVLGALNLVQQALGEAVAGTITGSVFPGDPPTDHRRVHPPARARGAARPGRSRRCRAQRAGRLGGGPHRAAGQTQHRETSHRRVHRMGQVRTVQVHRLLAKGSIDERIREIQQDKRLLFDAFARNSDAKDAHRQAIDTDQHRPEVLDDEAVPMQQRILLAERYRLGLQPTAADASR